VITVSAAVRDEQLARFRLDPARVHVVPNAADHFTPLARAPRSALVHVGHVEPRKNLELVVRALALDPELPPLELFGAAKNDEDRRLAQLARELGVAARVRFQGAFDDADLPRIYAGAACIVLPSRLEGFGISALEAQRAGAPLAIARIPALVEVAGAAVPSFAPDDPGECARALRAALATSAATLGQHADAAARFTWDRSAELWAAAWLGTTDPRRC
jgi:glycosyltransferase involved in cell wall biosynthesis